MNEADKIFLALAGLSLVLALVSGVRLVQRFRTGRYLSAGGFGLRLALSAWLFWIFAGGFFTGG